MSETKEEAEKIEKEAKEKEAALIKERSFGKDGKPIMYINPLCTGNLRNKLCVCNSGKKMKKCHGADKIITYTYLMEVRTHQHAKMAEIKKELENTGSIIEQPPTKE